MLQCLKVWFLSLGREVMMLVPMRKGGPCLDQLDSDWFTVYPLRDLTCSLCFEPGAGLLGAGPASYTLWKTLLVPPFCRYLQSYMGQWERADRREDSRSTRLLPYSLGLLGICKCTDEISSLYLRNSRLFEWFMELGEAINLVLQLNATMVLFV